MESTDASAVVISSAWPSADNGSGFAVMSLLEECVQVFNELQFIGLSDEEPRREEQLYPGVHFTHIWTRRLPKAIRFLLSLGSPLPATCHQFRSKNTINQILDVISNTLIRNHRSVVILEDLSIAVTCLHPIRKRFPGIPIAIRSENVFSKVFDPLTRQRNLLSRLVWTMELSKMRQAEILACRLADRVWAISENDRQEYLVRLEIRCDGVFGVSLNSDRLATIAPGDSQTVVFVGGVDLRKRLGIMNFLRNAWPVVRSEVPDARFVLAGIGSEKFNDPGNGILGLGYVEDDREVWSKGQIALNPQELGSGIKLKSIIAMLSAKALVSTETGVEGIEGENGTHYLMAPDARSLGPLIIQLMKDPVQGKEMGQKAKELATAMYSANRLRQSALPLLEDLLRTTVTAFPEER